MDTLSNDIGDNIHNMESQSQVIPKGDYGIQGTFWYDPFDYISKMIVSSKHIDENDDKYSGRKIKEE